MTSSFFHDYETLIWTSFHWLCNFDNAILKTCFKYLFIKTKKKNSDFILLDKSPEPYKLP